MKKGIKSSVKQSYTTKCNERVTAPVLESKDHKSVRNVDSKKQLADECVEKRREYGSDRLREEEVPIKESLHMRFKNPAKNSILNECKEVQKIVRNSVKHITEILNKGNSSLWNCASAARSARKMKQEQREFDAYPECVPDVKANAVPYSVKSVMHRRKQMEVSNKFQSETKGKTELKNNSSKNTLTKSSSSAKCNIRFCSLLLAVYKGWKVRRVLKELRKKGHIAEIKRLNEKLKQTKDISSRNILMNVYKYKKQQFFNFFKQSFKSSTQVEYRRYSSNNRSKHNYSINNLYKTKDKRLQKTTLQVSKEHLENRNIDKVVYQDDMEPLLSAPRESNTRNKFANKAIFQKKVVNEEEVLNNIKVLITKVRKDKKNRNDAKFETLIEELRGIYNQAKH